MGSKSFDFSEFYNATVVIRSNDYTVSGDMGLTGNAAVRVAALDVCLQAGDGDKVEVFGKIGMGGTHWACCADDQPLVVNGDLLVDGSTVYEVTHRAFVRSFMGSYFMMSLRLMVDE